MREFFYANGNDLGKQSFWWASIELSAGVLMVVPQRRTVIKFLAVQWREKLDYED